MKNINRLLACALGFVFVLLLLGCPGAGLQTPGDGEDPTLEEPWGVTGQSGGSVSVGMNSLPSDYRLWDTGDSVVTHILNAPIIRRNQQSLSFEPGLAASYTVAADDQTITVTLRSGLKWSDGQPLDASDIIFTANELVPSGVNTSIDLTAFGQPTTWELVDSLTYRVTTPLPYAAIVELASIPVVPEHIVKPVLDTGTANVDVMWPDTAGPGDVVGTGPFRIKNAASGGELVLERNPHYYEVDAAGTALPYLDEITLVTGVNPAEAVANGIVDIAPLDQFWVDSVAAGVSTYTVGPAGSGTFLTMNQNPIEGAGDNGLAEPALTWLQTKEFRRALAHIVNRSRMMSELYGDHGTPRYSPLHPSSPFWWSGVAGAAPTYDPTAAAMLLDGLGWTDDDGDGIREDDLGNSIALTLATNSGSTIRESMIDIIAQEAAAVGIDLTATPTDFNTLVGQLVTTYDWELIVIGLTQPVDPFPYSSNVIPSSGNLHMSEPNQTSPRWAWEQTLDDAWSTAATTTDFATRVSEYQEIQEVWLDENPWIYLASEVEYLGASSSLGNVASSYLHPFDGLRVEGIMSRVYVK